MVSPEKVSAVQSERQTLRDTSRFLGLLFESGRDKNGRRVSLRRQTSQENRFAAAIRNIMQDGFVIELSVRDRGNVDTTKIKFMRYYAGDFDHNPALISIDNSIMDVEDFCKNVARGGRISCVPTAETIAYYAVLNLAQNKEQDKP